MRTLSRFVRVFFCSNLHRLVLTCASPFGVIKAHQQGAAHVFQAHPAAFNATLT